MLMANQRSHHPGRRHPVPKENEVVMDIHYAALNPADRMMAERRYPYPVYPPPPHVLGRDGVGTVIQVGKGVKDMHVGDQRVLLRSDVGLLRWGTFAEQVSMPANALAEIPAGWTEEQSSGAAVVFYRHTVRSPCGSRSSRTQWCWSAAHREEWELRLCNWRRPWATRS